MLAFGVLYVCVHVCACASLLYSTLHRAVCNMLPVAMDGNPKGYLVHIILQSCTSLPATVRFVVWVMSSCLEAAEARLQ